MSRTTSPTRRTDVDRATAIFASALDDLGTRMGVPREDLSAADIVELVRASERVANPYAGVNADAVGIPVRVCEGVHFWKLTVGASVWLDEVERMFAGETGGKYRMCLVYALVNARNPEAFAIHDADAVTKAVTEACRRICATPDEIACAMDEVLGIAHRRPAKPADVEEAATDWRAICARLETQTGIPARDWIWKHSAMHVLSCYNDLHAFARAYSSGGGFVHMRDELDAASEALQTAKVAIMRRVRGGRPHV